MNYTQHLRPYLSERLTANVADLETAVAAGRVPNTLYTAAKETINRAVEEGAEAFLDTGPHKTVPAHHKSDWWLAAYRADAFARGAHTLPTVLKRAEKANLTEYAALLTAMLPLRALLENAKPLIVKRGDMPKVKTAKQIADEADRMTCQCCWRGIFAATGMIAHHGYERPGDGWQTASCMGARHLPFEADRAQLGVLIRILEQQRDGIAAHLAALIAETTPCTFQYSVYDKEIRRSRPVSREITRETFAQIKAELANHLYSDFDDLKERNVSSTERNLRITREQIAECRARFDGWKQTHRWNGTTWETV